MNLGHRHLATQLGLAALFARALDEAALAVAELLGQAVMHEVDGMVEIVAMVFRVDIGSGQREVHLHDEGVLERSLVVVPKRHVRADEVQPEMLQVLDLLGHKGMNRRGQLHVTRTDMDLHSNSSYIRLLGLSKA